MTYSVCHACNQFVHACGAGPDCEPTKHDMRLAKADADLDSLIRIDRDRTKALAGFFDYFDPRGGVSDVPLGPFMRAAESLGIVDVDGLNVEELKLLVSPFNSVCGSTEK